MSYEMLITEFPVDLGDLESISLALEKEDIIITGYSKAIFNPYDIVDYLKETHCEGLKFCAVFDLNILTDIVSLAKGEEITSERDQSKRLSSALLAFFQSAEVLIESGIALHEFSDSGHQEKSSAELHLFRAADNVHPQEWANIALGRSNKLDTSLLELTEPPSVPFGRGEDLSFWRYYYGVVLKIAMLESSDALALDKMTNFLQWMWKDYLFSSSGIKFAILYFSPRRMKGMVKGVNSSNISKALKGIRNAAWDLTVLNDWAGRLVKGKSQRESYLFCTADRALKGVANGLISNAKTAEDEDKELREVFYKHWGNISGEKLYITYQDLWRQRDCSKRRFRHIDSPADIYPYVSELEEELITAKNKLTT